MPLEQLIETYWPWLLLIALWSLPWKGWALWRAARKSDIFWFLLLLVVNTLGVLEIIYIFFISKTKKELG